MQAVAEEFIDLHHEGSDDPGVRFYEMLLGFYAVAPPEEGRGDTPRDDTDTPPQT
jgi:hypothetical protein